MDHLGLTTLMCDMVSRRQDFLQMQNFYMAAGNFAKVQRYEALIGEYTRLIEKTKEIISTIEKG